VDNIVDVDFKKIVWFCVIFVSPLHYVAHEVVGWDGSIVVVFHGMHTCVTIEEGVYEIGRRLILGGGRDFWAYPSVAKSNWLINVIFWFLYFIWCITYSINSSTMIVEVLNINWLLETQPVHV
jgi:hypothetical protein